MSAIEPRVTPGCDVPVTQQLIEDVIAGRVELAWLDGQPVVISHETAVS